MTAEARDSGPGERIGELVSDRYRILARLGAGGMGAVYVAEHTLMRKRVALKLLHPSMAQTPEAVARFRREAEAVASLEHPNITAATDFGQTPDGSFFLVLEYLDGQSLRKALQDGPMAPARALRIARQIALALDHAHAAGIVHRDLKPENVMLVRREDEPDFAKVLDFGVARIESTPERGAGQPLTRAGTVMGTPEYMAPEQALGERVTPRADLYSLGIVMYEMLTGRLPFEGDNIALMSLHIVAPVPPMAERAPGQSVPANIEALVLRLLEKEPAARLSSATELIAGIDEITRGGIPDAPPSERSRIVVRSSSATLASGDAIPAKEELAMTHAAMPAAVVERPPAPKRSALENARDRLEAFAQRPQVRELVASFRRQLDELLTTLEGKTKLPRPTLRIILASAAALLFATTLTIFLAVVLVHDKGAPNASTADASAAPPLGSEAPPEQVRTAAANGTASLEALAEQYPRDRAVLRELALSYDAYERTAEALRTIERIAQIEAVSVTPELVRIIIRATAKNETIDQAFRLLLDSLGGTGVDALVEIASSKDLPERARGRAISNLRRENVRANARPATALLIDLDLATSCEARHAALQRYGEEADARALGRLQALKSARGCGRGGRYDCNSCLRSDDLLENATRAAESRDER